ncbi:TetR/AcrR family transcriptional regulator [Mycobacterium sp. Y57]|uniref:TetR/AcrR family transcriptional regulator n=1 Tax=Mycolicibacterium xanthum TaxID=2796469 RepID=UPI001C85EDA9|nr:TetR/AcrR family transcriptional regulator [Mycolicibacterium xanthum]MBX7432133.1 TetR/AcrR family transcriptional regulator [Mycolicibacterium xanthum]
MPPDHRRSDAAANTDRIVTAARLLFAREGAGATLSKVAAAAGVSEATLYRHFPNRQALAVAVFQEIFDRDVRTAILDLDLDRTSLRQMVLDIIDDFATTMMHQSELLSSIDGLAAVTARFMTRDSARLEDLIARTKAVRLIRADVTAEEAATLIAMIVASAVQMNLPRGPRRRYLALAFDALTPPASEQSDFRRRPQRHAGPVKP